MSPPNPITPLSAPASLLLVLCVLASAGGGGGCNRQDEAVAGGPTNGATMTASQTQPGGGNGPATLPENVQTATFGGGCFWGVEAEFRKVPGVLETAVGYLGGEARNPTYKEVCTGQTGHAEVVQVKFDPDQVSYDQLLDVFWRVHNPTTLNRQGPDVGTQYRSAVFFHTPEQEAAARASMERLEASGKYSRPIVTEVTPATDFWRAEEYHQQYLAKRGLDTCHTGG